MYLLNQDELYNHFKGVRQLTDDICGPLATEDYIPQPVTDVSPPKWHLTHTTWFFEQFILVPYCDGYQLFNSYFPFLFNSYYNTVGENLPRSHRGYMTRPTVEEVYQYRRYVNQKMEAFLHKPKLAQPILQQIEMGLQHEQQHQELLMMDIKYILGHQILYPVYNKHDMCLSKDVDDTGWVTIGEGLYTVGADRKTFCFDNELAQHQIYLAPFQINKQLVSNQAYLDFINDGGYKNHNLWFSEGWDYIRKHAIECPMYWHQKEGEWFHYTLQGIQKLDLKQAVQHLSLYEASAFAAWSHMRLPTEFQWEVAAEKMKWGHLWEWTSSAYCAYPGFKTVEGALGEYNGKFMMNQYVLRGASMMTPEGHSRKTYRNFFHSSSRWLYSGIRLVKPL